MKTHQSAITIVNVILFLFFWWLFWVGHGYLPGQLNSEMHSDVMLQKYQIVCARLTAWLTILYLIVIVLVNAVLIRAYFIQKKNLIPKSSNNSIECTS